MSATKVRFNAVKVAFEATYQEIMENIYKAFENLGMWVYIIENTNDYAVVSVWDDEAMTEKLFKYTITIAEDGTVQLGEGVEVVVEYVEEGANHTEETNSEEVEELRAEIENLKNEIAQKDEQLQMSVEKFAKTHEFNKNNKQSIQYQVLHGLK